MAVWLLDLVVADSTVKVQQAENLFGLVEESSVFLSSSYIRMQIWERETKKQQTTHEEFYRLPKIGATRCWSKEMATDKLTNVITIFNKISGGNSHCKSRYMARIQ